MDKKKTLEKLRKHYFTKETQDEKDVIMAVTPFLKTSKFFIDVGASLGQYTHHANTLMDDGIIVAIEPDPWRFDALDRACKKWETQRTNRIITVNGVASNFNGDTIFYTTQSPRSGGILERNLPEKQTAIKCKSYRLDDLIRADETVDFVKIDVEGAEGYVLGGCPNILKSNAKFMIEIHNHLIDSNEIFNLLNNNGYAVNFSSGNRYLFVK